MSIIGNALWLYELNKPPTYTYTGTHKFIDDGDGNWRIKFLSSGTLTFSKLGNAENGIDVFLVGGGGKGQAASSYVYSGGGGGYTATYKNIIPQKDTNYSITIGAGATAAKGNGGASSAFGYSAAGGKGGSAAVRDLSRYDSGVWYHATGGDGGSGGGAKIGGRPTGGTDGGNGQGSARAGADMANWAKRGAGQGTTTREFGESTGTLYSGGGGSNYGYSANTGNGARDNVNGSSGIVIIRNHRK